MLWVRETHHIGFLSDEDDNSMLFFPLLIVVLFLVGGVILRFLDRCGNRDERSAGVTQT
jgi:undecaprenyl pyrophosphate phosphatase UppP